MRYSVFGALKRDIFRMATPTKALDAATNVQFVAGRAAINVAVFATRQYDGLCSNDAECRGIDAGCVCPRPISRDSCSCLASFAR